MRHILLFLALALTMAGNAQKISADKKLHSVNIFRWAKNAEDSLTDKIVLINHDGSVTYNGGDNYMKLDIAAVTNGFNKYIEGEKIEKIPAYGDDAMMEAHDPETGEQALHITIVRMDDYQRDKDKFTYPSEYFKLIVIPIGESPTELYKYLSPDVAGALERMLKD